MQGGVCEGVEGALCKNVVEASRRGCVEGRCVKML